MLSWAMDGEVKGPRTVPGSVLDMDLGSAGPSVRLAAVPFDPTRRLSRPLPGARQARGSALAARVFRREEHEERPPPIPMRDGAQAHPVPALRATRRLATAAPNAPLLIRIVRWPSQLSPGSRLRKRYLEDRAVDRTREPLPRISAALAEFHRVRFTSPVAVRPRPFAVRPSRWDLLPDLTHPSSSAPGELVVELPNDPSARDAAAGPRRGGAR